MSNLGPDYRFTFRPVWLLGHVVVVVSVVLFVVLGFWQLQRNSAQNDLDARITARLTAQAVPISELLATFGTEPEDLVLRRTVVEGPYLTTDEVIWQARSLGGLSGHDVLTPLQTADLAVVIDRGWVPIDVIGPPVQGAESPAGPVTVTGIILDTQTRGRLGPIDPEGVDLERISRVDIARLQQQIDAELYPFYIQLETQEPAQQGDFPIPQPKPRGGLGPPHLAYAVQWFVFAAVAVLGYPILIVRTARREPGRAISRREGSRVVDPPTVD